jgi:hypothetical protein
MHETSLNNVLGYIQEYIIECNRIYIVGWCFHKLIDNSPLRLCHNDIFVEDSNEIFRLESRKDVSASYNKDNLGKCGFYVEIFEPDNIKKLMIEIEVDGEWKTVFDLLFYETFKKYIPSFVVVDNFYKNPDLIRQFALKQKFKENPNNHKGKRTDVLFKFPNLKNRFETIIGCKIKNWEHYGVNSCFQSCIAGEQLVYHSDLQQYAGIIYLTPDAPPETGTTFFRSKYTKEKKVNCNFEVVFRTGVLDSTQFDVVDVVGNVYNRLILFDAQMIHAASEYFGNSLETGRLFQIFFFDLE